ncbi:MAG: hypothetical protein ACRDS9_27280, partial [Pseudonocardiaceae bacterium]
VVPFLSAMNGVVCCPTCGLAAIVEGRFCLQGTGGPIGRLRISCIDGHGWLLLADRVKEISPWDDLDQMISKSDHHVTMTVSEQVPLAVDHRQADQAE